MDIGAYAQIDDLGQIMKDNGIEVPRLRGLRLMKDEKPLTEDEIKEQIDEVFLSNCDSIIRSRPAFTYDPWAIHVYSKDMEKRIRKYLVFGEDTYFPVAVKWNALHGKARKRIKYERKQVNKLLRKQLETFNKYCGRDDVLYIHARIGGDNWIYYECDKTVSNRPWFIERIDDAYDNTYCDIYAKIRG